MDVCACGRSPQASTPLAEGMLQTVAQGEKEDAIAA
jgi:hypothetical protein